MKYLTALFAIFIAVVISLADAGQLGFLRGLYDFPYGDKAGHFLLYGILAFLVNLLALRSFPNRPKPLAWIVSMGLALVIGLEEWSQALSPHRTSEWADLVFSFAGVALGAWLAWKLAQKHVR